MERREHDKGGKWLQHNRINENLEYRALMRICEKDLTMPKGMNGQRSYTCTLWRASQDVT